MNYGVYYNHKTIGDILIIEFLPNVYPNKVIKKDDCVALYKDDELVGINIFNISEIVKIKANGYIPVLEEHVLKVINFKLENAGFPTLDDKKESGFKVSEIVDIEEHPESDHLHICKVNTGKEELQIVCGAFNARSGLKCVCATPYTFMPDGKQIVPGKLLKIDSFGMLCSGRELHLEGYENVHGLLELDDSYKVGDDFFLN